jgi:competence protein ComEC
MLPVFKILFWWILGVLTFPYTPFNTLELGILVLVLSLCFLVLTFNEKLRFKNLENVLLGILVILLVQFSSKNIEDSTKSCLPENTIHSVVLKVQDRYKQTDYQNKYMVTVESFLGDSVSPVGLNYLLLQKRDSVTSLFLPGDRFVANVYTKGFSNPKHATLFNAKKYWSLKNVKGTLWLQEDEILCMDSSANWYYVIRRFQIKLLDLIDSQNISQETKQILAALLLGDKRGVDKDLSSQFSRLGLVHTLALSGLHISLVYGICAFLLSIFLKHKPRVQSVVLVFIIVAYAVLTGLSPSVMRASLMFLLYAFSLLINRRTTAFNIVFLSALILLIYQPNLLYDIGFQLSYLAVIGIVYFYTKFKGAFENRSIIVQFFAGLALVSISAQLSTGLLSVYYFHSFPLSFLWANLVVLPLITLLLYEGLLYLILMLLGLNFSLIDVIIDQSVVFLLRIIKLLEQYSFAPVKVYLPGTLLWLLYGLLVLICIVFVEKHFKYLKFLYLYILTIVFYFMFSAESNEKELFVNASNRAYVISVIENNEQVLVSNNYNSASYLLGSYTLSKKVSCTDSLSINSIYKNEFFNLTEGLVQFCDQTILLISDQKLNMEANESVDILFMQKYRADVNSLKSIFTPKLVLLDASISNNNRLKLMESWQNIQVEVIDLKLQAYVQSY